MYCTKCGAKVDNNSKFCVFCGQPIENISNLKGSISNLSVFRNRITFTPKTGILVFLPVFIVLLAVYWLFIRYPGPDNEYVKTDVINYFMQARTERYGKDSTYAPAIQVKVGGGKKSHENVVFVPVDIEVNEKMVNKEITQPDGRKYTRTFGSDTRTNMRYLFVYQKDKDKQWIRKYAYPSEMEKWEIKPIADINEERFRSLFRYKFREIISASGTDKNSTKTGDIKIDNIKILNRKTDLVKGMEEIGFSCNLVNKNTYYIQQYQDVALLQFDYSFPQLMLHPHWKIVGFKSKMK